MIDFFKPRIVYNEKSSPFYTTNKPDKPDDTLFYTGPLTDYIPNGIGFISSITYKNKYMGEWRMGIVEGYGQMYFFKTNGTYTGKFDLIN